MCCLICNCHHALYHMTAARGRYAGYRLSRLRVAVRTLMHSNQIVLDMTVLTGGVYLHHVHVWHAQCCKDK